MKPSYLAFLLVISVCSLRAQDRRPVTPEPVAVLAPMVISGSFELQKRPSLTDLVIRDVELQFEQKRKAAEETARAPFWNAHFWEHIPVRLAPTDDQQFFNPSYLTLANQHSLHDLELAQKHPFIDSPAGH